MEVIAVYRYAAMAWLALAAHQVHQRALARSRASHDADQLAALAQEAELVNAHVVVREFILDVNCLVDNSSGLGTRDEFLGYVTIIDRAHVARVQHTAWRHGVHLARVQSMAAQVQVALPVISEYECVGRFDMKHPHAYAKFAYVDVLDVRVQLLGLAVDDQEAALVHHVARQLECEGLEVPIVLGRNAQQLGQLVYETLLVKTYLGFAYVVKHGREQQNLLV